MPDSPAMFTAPRDVLPGGRVFLANVGVNASHSFSSPLFEDGGFTLVTIPEKPELTGSSLVRYGQIERFGNLVPERFQGRATHYDPEFETLTYGDNCGRAARAAALRGCKPGDWIGFIARLVGPHGPAFALAGMLEVESILKDVREPPGEQAMERFSANAHIRRGLADPGYWDGFWVFGGSARSGLFRKAVLVGRHEAELLFRDRAGDPWTWRAGRSELQTIGSYTRSCRCIIDPIRDGDRHERFWKWLARESE